MAINISVTGLTPQQQQDVGDAFDQTISGRTALGLTKAQWVERNMIRFMKSVVKGWKRQTEEAVIATQQAQIDADYPEA